MVLGQVSVYDSEEKEAINLKYICNQKFIFELSSIVFNLFDFFK